MKVKLSPAMKKHIKLVHENADNKVDFSKGMKVLFDDIPKELAPFVKAYNERAKKDEACIHCAC